MYAYFTFYISLITLSIAFIFLSIFISEWFALFYIIPFVTFVLNRFQCCRIRCRACSLGPAPSTESELIKACEGRIPVGHGWSFFLQKKAPRNPVFTYNFCSSKPDKDEFWKAGTSIETVTTYYERKGLAFPSLPSYQNISLGAWIMTQSHGSSGDQGEGSNSRFSKIIYWSGKKKVIVDREKREKLNREDVKCILYVSFNMDNSPNIWLTKQEVKNFTDWIAKRAYQRVCFIGKKHQVMIRWEKVDDQDYRIKENRRDGFHLDPHLCSRFCLWFQADVCLTIGCRCKEPSKNFNSYVKLAEVNRFVPFVFPVLTLFLWDIVNFEIILKKTEADVVNYFEKIKEFHDKYGGRTEIRYGKTLFLDVSLQRKYINQYFESVTGEGKYHLGKYQPVKTLANLTFDYKFKL